MGEYIYLVQMDVPAELEAEFNRVYDEQHVPEILTVDGVTRCTRYRLERSGNPGMPRYCALYEIATPELPESAAWRAASEKGDWATRIRPHTSNRSHALFRRIAEMSARDDEATAP